MSTPSANNSIPPETLVQFRTQAAAIVAEQRGLTSSCLVKLAGLARQLGIPEDQTQAAIHTLDSSRSVPETVDAKAVHKFRKRLRKDLTGKKKIIGPEIEARILANAKTKYALDERAARQDLAEVVAELARRVALTPHAVPQDDDLVATADRLFTELDRRERSE